MGDDEAMAQIDSMPELMRAILASGCDEYEATRLVAAWLRTHEVVVWELLRQVEGL